MKLIHAAGASKLVSGLDAMQGTKTGDIRLAVVWYGFNSCFTSCFTASASMFIFLAPCMGHAGRMQLGLFVFLEGARVKPERGL
jgi:hypothetical protein